MLLLAALEVLRLISAAESAQADLRRNYRYEEVQENWRLDPLGREIQESRRSKGYEWIWVNGGRYRKLVSRNGQPLTPEEQWQVEEEMRRFRPAGDGPGWLGYAEQSLELTGNTLRIVTEEKRIEVEFDPETYLIRRQIVETGMARTEVEYRMVGGGVSLPARSQVDFRVEGIRGRQLSSYSGYRPAQAAD